MEQIDTSQTLTPLTVEETARRLGVTTHLVRKLVATDQLPAHKIGGLWRFSPLDVEAYWNCRRNKAPRYEHENQGPHHVHD